MVHRGTNTMVHLSVGSYHAGVVHSNGQLYTWVRTTGLNQLATAVHKIILHSIGKS